ncbi:molecular chaperone DnaK [Candidatus Giovannonibacteria bacterium RIFCSPLOWO2_12_FULL_44_25]|uniref:Chaperone protein DnaK n=2 Tax=Candidatus Giovannoniibacteriota TaxID=1752738 RepID=A0A1F5W7D2_9BACT|nr:MAG: Chaperone protein DnaK [Parcubacteria group bacterium GW2011_GWC1_44_10]KKT60013.1 MAG: Chaperone protein DnaK [Candidatus Giovannonibacteria bacterium GW2011_GWA1_44_25]KKU30131.1 MAG: Chaperone protein DnaK [Candidatus Giovannonibacteria bacterium GW2011_GWB1_46_20]OGF49713.1 MAG: molecular chaperone DnaK [Candidatus Giovannonibacteria bacterium GWA2_45_15]OGF61217.1 MAG: molecular chaperone DnaK [Candidatus Giovannonibacteria bacterium RIFCSPHIGHO2_01_FULL_44_100]OGF71576.1 MAG: mol
MSKILGIDLGTTNSAMAIVEGGVPKILENAEGARTTPSIVAFSKSGERLVGLLAKRQAVTNPRNTIFSVKRLIGRKASDAEVKRDKTLLPYEIKESANGGVEVKINEKWYRPEEVSAMILAKLKADAEAKLGEKIEDAIITVPAYFDDSQRQATKAAGEIAGFKVKRILNEPTAAALAYGLNKKRNEKIVVYDFGGGTFDLSVLEIGDDTIEVRATGGDTHLGGDDFDQKIIQHIAAEFKKESGIDVTKDVLALQRLKEAAEKAKHELSTAIETEINIPFITSDASGPVHLQQKMARAKLEDLVRDFLDKSFEITKNVVREAKFELKDIDEIVLVGGQTRMPAIQEGIKKLFGKEANLSINPDEVVAVGAAVQGGILQGDVKDVLLLDVTPLSLGIETLGGVMTKIIEKNTTVPVARSQVFSTAADNQTSVEIHVLQGEREMAGDNKTLGRFILDGIPPSPRGMPQVEVSFDIDANGILSVKAKDKATNKEQSIRIEASTGLSKDEIEKMKRDAEAHADEDRQKKELIESKNRADALVYTAEKSLRDAGDKVEQAIKDEVNQKIEALKKAKEGNDISEIRNAETALAQSLSKIGEAMYKQGGAQGEKPEEKGPDIKDADFKEEGDK